MSKRQEALDYHSMGRKGKIEVITTKPCATSRDLALAYSPGVAEPCLEIEKNPDDAYKYTAKGNLVAVVSNGTAVLGLGDGERAIGVFHKPAPARAELARTRGREGLFEGGDGAEAFGQGLFEAARHSRGARTHHLPELVVVPKLADVVEDAVLRDGGLVIGADDDLFERLALPLGPGNQLVAVVDIGLVVQVVVILERLARHTFGGQRVVSIGKIGERESHGMSFGLSSCSPP